MYGPIGMRPRQNLPFYLLAVMPLNLPTLQLRFMMLFFIAAIRTLQQKKVFPLPQAEPIIFLQQGIITSTSHNPILPGPKHVLRQQHNNTMDYEAI